MADKKVSEESDLGYGGIDGTVQYRVVKAGGTYRQSYDDLFTYIDANATPNTLQEVIDHDHSLTYDQFFAGTDAGAGVSTSQHRYIAIGEGAGAGNSANQVIALGYNAGAQGFQEIGNLIAIGYMAGNSINSGGGLTAIGDGAMMDSSSIFNSIAIGTNASFASGNDASMGVAIGYCAMQQNQGWQVIGLGLYAGKDNLGTDCVLIGTEAGTENTSDNVINIGNQAGMYNQGANVVSLGARAGMNNMGSSSIQTGS